MLSWCLAVVSSRNAHSDQGTKPLKGKAYDSWGTDPEPFFSNLGGLHVHRSCKYLWRELGEEGGGVDPSLREGGRVGGRGGKQKDSAGVGRGVQARGGRLCKEHVVGGGPPAHGGRRNLTHHASSLHASHKHSSSSGLLTHSLRPTHHIHPPAYSCNDYAPQTTFTHLLTHTFDTPHISHVPTCLLMQLLCRIYTSPLGYSTHTHCASHLALTDVRHLDLQCKHEPAFSIKAVQVAARGSRTVWWVVMQSHCNRCVSHVQRCTTACQALAATQLKQGW